MTRRHATYISPAEIEHVQIQYELAMSIGTSLEMRSMLKISLSSFLRRLNCSSGSVYIFSPDRDSGEPVYSIPRNLERNRSTQIVGNFLPHRLTRDAWLSFCAGLPLKGGDSVEGYYHILELPNIGFISLIKQGEDLSPIVVKSLTPLLLKLGAACQACLQSEELAATHQKTMLERNMLRALIDNTPIIAFALDVDGLFTLSEGHGLRALQRAPGEVIGKSIFEIYESVPAICRAVRQALGGQPVSRTIEFSGLSFDARYEPVMDSAGNVIGVIGVAHDITERKEAVDTLSAVLNTVGEAIITIDQQGTIVMMNRAVEEIFGYERDELIHRPLETLMPERYRDAHHEGMRTYAKTGVGAILGKRLELEGLHKSGRILPLEVFINETMIGEKQFFTAAVRDITSRKEYDRMREDFVSTVSHELRTPLASIMGWTETLMSERPGPLTDTQKRFLNIAYQSSLRLNSLIEEILTVSRIQSGSLKVNKDSLLPSQVMEGVVEMVNSVATARSIAIHVENQWPSNDTLVGDAGRLEQVLSNLIDNAIKFSEDGSSVYVRSGRSDDGWHVEIEDHGIGIPKSELPKLFQRFYRATTATEANIQGTGIGLFLCRAVIEGHGGKIGIDSKLGKGTIVWFTVPETPIQ